MAIKVKVPTTAQIEELRQRFNTKYAEAPPTVPFHPVDLDRIRNDHVWLQRFLEMYDLDMETSFTKLWDTCIWRQSYGANDLTEDKLNQQYLNEGSVFVHSHDVDGKPLLIFRVKLHSKTKNVDELIRIVVYWVERKQRETHMTQLSIFFDMAGTGLATMDLDFVKRIVETFKLYYPNSLNYILVFELAWVLNAAFKVIKTLLPPKAVEILKMISKKDVTQYVPKDNCLVSWGGSDSYEFQFVPEPKRALAKPKAANAGDDDQPHDEMGLDKKVTFSNSVRMAPHDSSNGKLHTPSDLVMLQLEPKEFVNICKDNGEAKVSLRNICNKPVVYKIQTTSPEKFRVRPRCGIIPQNESTEVHIWLKSDQILSSDGKDKFLVMATCTSDSECGSQAVADMWRAKSSTDPDVETFRLVCRMDEKSECAKTTNMKSDSSSSEFGADKFQEQAQKMEAQLNFTKHLQYATLALLLLLFIGFGFLMYEQMIKHSPAGGSCRKAPAYTCPKRK
ncbi:motile sperm domain-containing protein 2-like isoform X2 [Drosophila mojavensis]|uniref:motile sperm domain-containing protein 2-like isoform X2 n=1 Tax=Drosophila mojavensis TaxID=7230 RepID=UPI00017CA1CA|nr:motile sperm domain-containing protein 2-like isoform X2 [Drosophila mojavensis]